MFGAGGKKERIPFPVRLLLFPPIAPSLRVCLTVVHERARWERETPNYKERRTSDKLDRLHSLSL